MPLKLKISPHEHSGHLKPHEHTSYALLGVLVLVVGMILTAYSSLTVPGAAAGGNYTGPVPGPGAGSIGLTGTVPTNPPKLPATLTTPNDSQHFTTSPITVSGTCPLGTLVEIFKNDIFAGSVECSSQGVYTISIDLLYGENSITAQDYNIINEAGPPSSVINVYYDNLLAQSSLSTLNFRGTQLVLSTNAVYRGSFPLEVMNVPVTIMGGVAPFALNVEWGDSSNKIVPVGSDSVVNVSHIYQKPGTYQITLQATDSAQQVAFLTVAAVINGQPSAIGTTASASTKSSLNKFIVLWSLFAVLLTMVVSFYLGERREKKLLVATVAPTLNLGPTPH